MADFLNNQGQEKKKEIKLEIQLDDQIAQGVYCNLAMINHNEGEFCMDFIFVQPQQPKARVRARVLTSPAHAKRIATALNENIAKYEKKYGTIRISTIQPIAHGQIH
ncbi:MAG: DUF3467 domain-containing protein [Deltaproteobacteria bacterium]|nr:DUF3467 domain-containing protein [Deltaproteobacteria bacterium]